MYEVLKKITYPYLNFNSANMEVWDRIISSYNLLDVWLFIHVGIKVNTN